MKIAHEIIVTSGEGGHIDIDGVTFPFHVMDDIEVERIAGHRGAPAILRIGVLADNLTLVSSEGRRTVVAQSNDDVNRAWARQRAREIVVEGMYDVLEWIKGGRDGNA